MQENAMCLGNRELPAGLNPRAPASRSPGNANGKEDLGRLQQVLNLITVVVLIKVNIYFIFYFFIKSGDGKSKHVLNIYHVSHIILSLYVNKFI